MKAVCFGEVPQIYFFLIFIEFIPTCYLYMPFWMKRHINESKAQISILSCMQPFITLKYEVQ